MALEDSSLEELDTENSGIDEDEEVVETTDGWGFDAFQAFGVQQEAGFSDIAAPQTSRGAV